MVTKLQKEETIEELKTKIGKAESIYATDNAGLTVAQITELRTRLRKVDAEYKIAKNTLINIAAKGTSYEEITKDLEGPTALLLCYGDVTAPTGIVKKFVKDEAEDKVAFKAGVLDGEVLDAAKITEIASLPSKEVLLSQIAGLLVAAPSQLAYIFGELGEKGEGTLKDFEVGAEPKADEAKAEEKPAEEAKTEEAPKAEEAPADKEVSANVDADKTDNASEKVEENKEEGK